MVAMSGGVDSATAAALLQKQGYEIIGATMCFSAAGARGSYGQGSASGGHLFDEESIDNRKKPSCCGMQGIEDARKTAHALGIKHYVFSFGRALEEKIIKNFCAEYLAGRTPNPCVRCNQFLKFDLLFKKAMVLSCDYLATGHYVKLSYNRRARQYLLKKAKDIKKDQSYFLYVIKKETLPYLLFPLGNYTKEEVRLLAHNFNLPVSNKLSSQEICFIPNDNYRSFISERIERDIRPGPLIHIDGRVLGEHQGIPFYTIGQRKALGGGNRMPLYVIRIDNRENTIILGEQKHTYAKALIADNLNFLTQLPPKKIIAIDTKIRYNHREVKSRLIPINADMVKIEFSISQRAVTPGQSVVFYQKDAVLGGGIIRESI